MAAYKENVLSNLEVHCICHVIVLQDAGPSLDKPYMATGAKVVCSNDHYRTTTSITQVKAALELIIWYHDHKPLCVRNFLA